MYLFKIKSSDLEGMFLVPYHRVMQKTKHFKTTLGDLEKQITNGIDVRKYYENGKLYIRASDVKRCQVNLLSCKRIKIESKEIPKKIILEERDILVTRKGTPGITSIVSKDSLEAIIGTEIIKIKLKERKNFSPEYVYTFLNSDLGIMQIQGRLTGTVSRGINHRFLRGIKIPELSDNEHEKIYKWVKEAKEKHTKGIEKIETAKKIFLESLNMKINNSSKTFVISFNNLNDMLTPKFYYPKYVNVVNQLSKKFKMKTLEEISSDISKGEEVGSKNYKPYIEKTEVDLPFIRTTDLVNYEIDDYPDFYINEDIYKNIEQDLQPKDIVFTKDGKIGMIAMIMEDDKCILSSGISKIRMNEEFSPEYVLCVLSSFVGSYQAYQRVVVSSTIPHLNTERLKEIKIPIINSNNQEKITQLIQEAFKFKREKKMLIKKAKTEIEKMLLN